jgi:uncharacterized membrane protein YqjE
VNTTPDTGVVKELRHACANAIDMLKTRVALCAIETEQHVWHLLTLMWIGFATLTSIALALMLFTLLFIIMLWDRSHLLAIGTAACFFTLLSIGLVTVLLQRLVRQPHWLSATTLELQKDSEALRDHS